MLETDDSVPYSAGGERRTAAAAPLRLARHACTPASRGLARLFRGPRCCFSLASAVLLEALVSIPCGTVPAAGEVLSAASPAVVATRGSGRIAAADAGGVHTGYASCSCSGSGCETATGVMVRVRLGEAGGDGDGVRDGRSKPAATLPCPPVAIVGAGKGSAPKSGTGG